MNSKQKQNQRMHRIALAGGTQIKQDNARFYERFGWELASDDRLLIVTGGFKHFVDAVNIPSADWSAITGALAYLDSVGISPESRIETVLPEPENDWSRVVRFEAGKMTILHNCTLEARRFSIVHKADAMVTIQGSKGTRQMIDLALAVDKMVLPLPFTGGVSKKRWFSNKKRIQEWFYDDERPVLPIESIVLEGMTNEEMSRTAKAVKSLLLNGLRKRCESQYYSCFISYSSQDEEFVKKLHYDLQTNGVRCWYAPHDLPIGAKTREELEKAIYNQEKLLLVLSQASVGSQWVEQEVETALQKEREENNLVLFPIRIDDSIITKTTGWASYLKQTRNIGDFTKWRNAEFYQKALERLLRDLRVE